MSLGQGFKVNIFYLIMILEPLKFQAIKVQLN